MMIDQTAKVGNNLTLRPNEYTNQYGIFNGWNTMPDGSGTSYANNDTFPSLSNDGDTVTLYAQWLDHYYVHYDANGGTGTMEDQEIFFTHPDDLTSNAFVKTDYEFFGWNTEADGTGISFIDGESASHITHLVGDTITLYAQYLKRIYIYNGTWVCDGTVNSFIDTGVNFLSAENVNKDFEVRFTVNSVGTLSGTQPTIFNAKDESNSYYPGFALRYNNINSPLMIPVYRWHKTTGTNMTGISKVNVPIEFIYRRRDRVVTLQYKYNNFDSGILSMYDQRNWTLNQNATDNASFCGIYNDTHTKDRFFNGTISNMRILIDD